MKDLILITAYCPTFEKIKVLHNLLKDLENFRDKYDVMLCSHTKVDRLLQEYCDYYFYSKDNDVLTDIQYLQNGWVAPWGKKIWSTYISGVNTAPAIFSMLIPGISIAKSIGYEKIHYMEYDTKIDSIFEINENSKDLDEYDYIIYRNENGHKMIGSFYSFRVDGIIEEYKNYSKEFWENTFSSKYPRIPENTVFELIENQRKYKIKNFDLLLDNGISTSFITGVSENWCFPFFDHSDYNIKLFVENKNENPFDIKVIVNGNKIVLFNQILNGMWSIETLDNIEDIQNILVLKNNEIILKYDFMETELTKDKFLRLNYFNPNEQ